MEPPSSVQTSTLVPTCRPFRCFQRKTNCGETGRYARYVQWPIYLETRGEWVLNLDFTKPQRDRIVKKIHLRGADKQMKHENNSDMVRAVMLSGRGGTLVHYGKEP